MLFLQKEKYSPLLSIGKRYTIRDRASNYRKTYSDNTTDSTPSGFVLLTFQVMIHNVHTVSVHYHEFENCNHSEAILYLLRHSLNNTISLSELMNIRIDGFRRPSYTARISDLRRKGYIIENSHVPHDNFTESAYSLRNPDYTHTIQPGD